MKPEVAVCYVLGHEIRIRNIESISRAISKRAEVCNIRRPKAGANVHDKLQIAGNICDPPQVATGLDRINRGSVR